MVSTSTLISFLKANSIQAGTLDRLKMVYRPLVCPYTHLIGYVNNGEVIADIGCGSGQFCLLLAEFSPASAIYGFEIKENLIENAKKLCRNHTDLDKHFEIFNGLDFPDKVGDADVIFLIDVFHHIPPVVREKFMDNLYKKIKPGARLILKDIDAGSPFVIFNKLHDLVFYRQLVHENSLPKTKSILEKIKFKILYTEKKRMYVYPHYTIIAKK